MKTPPKYTENLKNGIVTDEMLEDVLYSYNKRAKNYRDKEFNYRHNYYNDIYNNADKAKEMKELLYDKKSKILLHCTSHLAAVHCLTQFRRKRIYDYDDDYSFYRNEINLHRRGEQTSIIREGSYFDKSDLCEVHFIDVRKKEITYFLFYEFPNYSFHSPIIKRNLIEYDNLEHIELDKLETKGKDINDLLSLQFCDKVLEFITKKNEI